MSPDDGGSSNIFSPPSHLPRQTVGLGAMIAEVRHFAVLDVHPCLPHVVFGLAAAALPGSNLRDGADVRATLAVVCARPVLGGVP